MVPNGWVSIEFFLSSLATVQPHNGYELNIKVFQSLCYDKTSASSFGTAYNKKKSSAFDYCHKDKELLNNKEMEPKERITSPFSQSKQNSPKKMKIQFKSHLY